MKRFLCFLIFFFVYADSFAANISGTINGTVTDAKSDPLTGVVVAITATSKGAVTDFDGKYEIKGLENGTYEIVFTYPTYKTYKQSITITGNQDVVLNMKMYPETTELKGTEIKAIRITNTENSVINEIRTSNTIVSGTSQAQISKTLDRNAAEVAKRIPGVTIQDDRFIVIRGLPDRYNTVWLNDASTPSSEADKKSFSFDIIPAGLIDRLLIYKAPSPELPGDFAGGMVKVFSTCLTDKDQVIISLSASSREYTTGTNFNANKHGATDWLGYDDGKRSMPKGIPDFISSKDPNYKTNIASWSKSFGNDWTINTTKASPDYRFSAAMAKVFKFKKWKLSNIAGLVYSNVNNNTRYHRQDFDSTAMKYNYSDLKSTTTVNAGFMENIGASIGNTKIEFRNLYNQVGTSSITIRNAIRDTGIATHPDERSYNMGYDSRATYASELSGTHKNKADTRKYNWTLGYTDLFKNQPDLRRIKYSKVQSQSDSFFKAQVANQVDIFNGGGRYYASLYEHTYSFNHMLTQTIKVNDDFSFDVNAGNYLEYKARSYKIRELGYLKGSTSTTTTNLLYLPVDQIFADSNVDGSKRFKIGENTNGYDHYNAQNELIASFINLKVPIGKRLTLCGGVRYEYNMQSFQGILNFVDTVSSDVKTKFLLPSVNASYNFSEKSLIRAAYGKTVNRPEFREWSNLFYYDFDEIAGIYGALYPNEYSKNSPNSGDTLKVAEIQNFDVRYELYPSTGEMISVGGFYKSMKNPIVRAILNSSDNKSFTFINADNGYCYGIEVDVRKNLSVFDSMFHTKIFSNFTLVGNLTLAQSQLTIDTAKRKELHDLMPKSNLQGQSPYIVNMGMYYQSAELGLQGSLLYNVFGARMYALGKTIVGGESIGEMPVQTFDFTLSKLFHKHYILTLGVQNMLDSRVVYMLDVNRDRKYDSKHDLEYKTYNIGRYYTIGIKVKF
jgi:hypothetical protein